ncbi:MAG: efflux RND transporter periplasmic adaptor subunit [Betaproteobacteria bacterium]|nr:efflux RND transporter periplasmic adaptor subunit [Betaproteobacteria bacterium]
MLRSFFKVRYLVLAIVLVISGVLYAQFKERAEKSKLERYRTAQVDKGAVIQRITANGTLNPVSVVNVGTQVSGTVLKLHTDYNQPVKANQVLLEIDPALIKARIQQFEANMRSAEATLRLAETTLQRNETLVAKGFISPSTLDQNRKEVDVANAQVAQVRSQLEQEKTNLAYTIIRSPIDGIVIDRKVDIGQTVAASFQTPTLFQIARDLENMQIDTSVAEADVGKLSAGMPIRFTTDAFPDRDFAGKVRMVRLNPSIQQNVVTYNVIVDVTNDQGLLKPGMTAQVNIVVSEKQDVIRLPNAALRFKPPREEKDSKAATKPAPKNAPAAAPAKTEAKLESAGATSTAARRPPARVFKLNDKRELVPVEVRVGIASNQHTELLSGALQPGDELVIRDLQDRSREAK